MFQNFQTWKLHSFQDYLLFFLVIFAGALILWWVIRRISNRRNDAHALKIVKKKLKLPAAEGHVYHDLTLSISDQELHYDHLLIDAAGIVAVRSIGWGVRIYGKRDQPVWKIMDNKTERALENPVARLEGGFETLRQGLAAQGVYGLSVDPLVIFADPFAPAELYLGRDSGCISFTGLPDWKKQRRLRAKNKTQPLDVAAVAAAIEHATFLKKA